ncbi:pyridoxal-phosphate dependent enzyme [soil metagenome]
MPGHDIAFDKIFIQPLKALWLQPNNIRLDVLRLDVIHPVVSGNKWFKLKYYLADAKEKHAITIGSFGGAYSNHIVALAYSCKKAGIKSLGVIRGEEPATLSATLTEAKTYGMELHFVSRTAYSNAEKIKEGFKEVYWIPEGGYGLSGAEGAAYILDFVPDFASYSHIVCATGTGTMLAGILRSALSHQTILGISVMKGNTALAEKVAALLDGESRNKNYKILHGYHLGGYAKYPVELIAFMNDIWAQHQLPTDIIYTSKALYAAQQMIMNHTIPPGSNVLFIHSGGLQGNRSLPPGTLHF